MSTQKNGEGLISYQENKMKGHKLITQVLRESFADFVPQYNLKRIKKKAEESKEEAVSSTSYPQVKIEEVYLFGKNFETMNNMLKEPMT